MTAVVNRYDIEKVLGQFSDPYLGVDLLSSNCVSHIDINNAGAVKIELLLPYPCGGYRQDYIDKLTEYLRNRIGSIPLSINLQWEISSYKAGNAAFEITGVKNIIAVASGKGGVGKSTVAANLAVALLAEGSRVGVLDADIYGPSQDILFGVESSQKPSVIEKEGKQYFKPLISNDVQLMSIAFLVDTTTPMVWRGPMVSGALKQLLCQTIWDDLDYLIVDMPPGTGDIQITLSQQVPVSGAIIVTTPQDIALKDARRGVEMFDKVKIPRLGIIENMGKHVCSECGHEEALFSEGGGQRIADEYQMPFLGSLPLLRSICEQSDSGKPTVLVEPDGVVAKQFREIARKATANLALSAGADVPQIEITDI